MTQYNIVDNDDGREELNLYSVLVNAGVRITDIVVITYSDSEDKYLYIVHNMSSDTISMLSLAARTTISFESLAAKYKSGGIKRIQIAKEVDLVIKSYK